MERWIRDTTSGEASTVASLYCSCICCSKGSLAELWVRVNSLPLLKDVAAHNCCDSRHLRVAPSDEKHFGQHLAIQGKPSYPAVP